MNRSPGGSDQFSSARVRFWPFSQRAALLLAPVVFVVLLIGWGLGRSVLHFQTVSSGWVLLGIGLISGVPVLLLILEGMAVQGGSVEVGSVKIALTAGATRQAHVVVPRNAAPPGAQINDSGSTSILESLRDAKSSNIVVIDLERGQAWWETRLLIVCAGARRLGQPEVVVFVADSAGKPNQFVGWSRAGDLLDVLLTNSAYLVPFERAAALSAAARLARGVPPPVLVTLPPDRFWMVEAPAPGQPTMNPFLEEQLLAAELAPLEAVPAQITETSLRSLFSTVLHQRSVDQTDRDSDWFRKALLLDAAYLPITDGGTYVGLMPRSAVVSTVLLQLADS
jgi:hypothetical protein